MTLGFRLSGPSPDPKTLDPREAAVRPDLADVALAGRIARAHYACPVVRRVAVSVVDLRSGPEAHAPAVSQLLFGEGFAVLDLGAGAAWGYGLHDHYVGYVDAATLTAEGQGGRPVLVGPGDGLLLADPTSKARVVAWLPAGAELAVGDGEGEFLPVVAGPGAGGYVHRRHVMPGPAPDWVAVAEGFLGAPYRWGGRARTGLDCSGLLQVARKLVGRPARRDSDMLFADAGPDLGPGEPCRRGDLAWWPGHIGVMVDDERLLHANAFHMRVTLEPLHEVEARLGVPARRRRPLG
ncbi:MAG: NlpC/P60 family protein [Sphingomonadaceae bacterium]|uniref:C40 family peptidase n=1 Tax=Thermaurantiacus sp. TaxID=2820283 RepID=UPI00298EE386|nr:NlpC/P60 family protein [Thermaurantiacus sp.]MCS6987466.1 NlpC/P60 family protein [Sphingomonadaceae bacterium]MDW8415386.1 NlpC/P60 family protein [Thermaurantiacus sp.]